MDIFKSNIDFNAYKTFYAVAVFESFSKAAEELCISQPSVSYSIKKLEEELDVKLFIRLSKGIKLTDEGEKLKFYIENAFNNIATGYKALKENTQELTGEISIGIHSNIGTFLLPKYIKKFLKLHPNVKISIFNSTTNEMKEMFKNRKLDILILHYPIFANEEKFEEIKLFSCDSCFFGIKKFYDDYIVSKAEKLLIEYPLLLPLKGFITSNALDKIFKKNNMILSSNVYLYTTEMIVSLAKEGIGIGWALKDCIQQEIENGIFYELPLEFEMPKIEFSLAYSEKYINKTALNFAQFIVEQIKKDKGH